MSLKVIFITTTFINTHLCREQKMYFVSTVLVFIFMGLCNTQSQCKNSNHDIKCGCNGIWSSNHQTCRCSFYHTGLKCDQQKRCIGDHFQCTSNGKCIKSNKKCNKEKDCDDESDEMDCPTDTPSAGIRPIVIGMIIMPIATIAGIIFITYFCYRICQSTHSRYSRRCTVTKSEPTPLL